MACRWKSVDGGAGLRHRQQRQARGGKCEVGLVGRRQADDVDHQRGGIVAGSRGDPGRDEFARGLVGCVAPRQDFRDLTVCDAAMDAVAAQEITVVEAQGVGGVIDADAIFRADRAGEDVPQSGAGHGVVGGHLVEPSVAPAIGAGVADVDHMDLASAQDERGQRARHPREVRVAPSDGMRPGIEGLHGAGAAAVDAERLVLAEMAFDERAHREFGRLPSALGAADAIGNRRHRAQARLLLAAARVEGGIVLVAFTRTGIGRESEAKLEPGWAVGGGFAGGANGFHGVGDSHG